jgi:hypothetical protein
MEQVGLVWRPPQVFFSKYLSLAFEGGFDHTSSGDGQHEGWLRKFHDRASNWGRSPILQPTCTPRLCHVRQLVERLPRTGWRYSVSGSNAWLDLWRSGRVVVLIITVKRCWFFEVKK